MRARCARYPLVAHCLDVAAVFFSLVSDSQAVHNRLESLSESPLSRNTLLKLTYLVALAFDAWKANIGFQSKDSENASLPRSRLGFLAFLVAEDLPAWAYEVLRLEELLGWGCDGDGECDKALDCQCVSSWKPRQYRMLKEHLNLRCGRTLQTIRALHCAELGTAHALIFGVQGVEDVDASAARATIFQHAFSGLVMLASIGSLPIHSFSMK